MKVLVVDTIHEALVSRLTSANMHCEVYLAPDRTEASVAVKLKSEGFEGLVLRSGITVGEKLMLANPQLKFIGRVGAGLEHIDLALAEQQNIAVISSPEGNRQAVAEHALGSLLSAMNHIHTADREVRSGRWVRKANEGVELSGKTVGIIGYGNTGSAFAALLTGFGVTCLAYDKYKSGIGNGFVQEVEMEAIYNQADVVSIHLPLNHETRYMVDSKWLGAYQKPIFFINTSRGEIVNTSDLLDALDQAMVKFACLDVLEFETATLEMPQLQLLPDAAHRLFDHPNVLLTPHIAGLTTESYQKLSTVLADKIIAHFEHA